MSGVKFAGNHGVAASLRAPIPAIINAAANARGNRFRIAASSQPSGLGSTFLSEQGMPLSRMDAFRRIELRAFVPSW